MTILAERLRTRRSASPVRRTTSTARSYLPLVILLLIAVLLVLPPLYYMVWASLSENSGFHIIGGALGLGAYREVLTSSEFRGAAIDTVVFAGCSTVAATALGALLAWIVARTDVPLKGFAYASAFLSFSMPGVIEVIGWLLLFGHGNGAGSRILSGIGIHISIETMPGLILVQTLAAAPMAFLLLVGPFRMVDSGLEEGAQVAGATWTKTTLRITAPLLTPTILSVFILVGIRCIQAFEVPLFLGTPANISTFTSVIYTDLNQGLFPDYATTAAYGVILVVVLLLLLVIYHRVTRTASKYATVTGRSFRANVTHVTGWRRYLLAAVPVVVFLFYLCPVFTIAVNSLWPQFVSTGFRGNPTLQSYDALFAYPQLFSGIRNSIEVGVGSATLAVLLTAVAAWVVTRTKLRGRTALDQVISIPMVIPGAVLGFALLVMYLRVPIAIYGTLWIFVIAYVIHYSPYAIRFVAPSLVQISRELEDSARVCGASWFTMFRRTLVPLLTPAIAGAWLLVFFNGFRDISVVAFIYTSNTPVVPSELLDMWRNGQLNVLTAYGALLSVVSILIGTIAFSFARRGGIRL